MKKAVLAITLLAIVTLESVAQNTKKGNFMVNGSSDLTYSSLNIESSYKGTKIEDASYKVKSFNFKPEIGYFIKDNLAFTFSMNYEVTEQEEIKTRSTLYGPGLMYFIGNSQIRPILLGEIQVGSTKQENEYYDKEMKFTSLGWDLAGGAAIFITDNASFNVLLGYAKIKATGVEDDEREIQEEGFALRAGFSLYF